MGELIDFEGRTTLQGGEVDRLRERVWEERFGDEREPLSSEVEDEASWKL